MLFAFDIVTFRSAMVQRLSTEAEIIGLNCASALLFDDPGSAEQTLAALQALPQIESAGVFTREGKLFATYGRKGIAGLRPPARPPDGPTGTARFQGGQLLVFRPIIVDGEAVGDIYIRADLTQFYRRLASYGFLVILALVVSFLATHLIAARLQRLFTRPILQLVDTAQAVSQKKDFSVRAASTGRDELGILVTAFNEMLDRIEAQNSALERSHLELERRVEERTAALQVANQELEAFTYSVSHDLRAPLRHMDGFARLLEEDCGPDLSADAHRYLKMIQSAARQMGCLIDDLLNLSRVARRGVNSQVVDLSSLVDEVIQQTKSESPERTIEWLVDKLPFADCDPALMKQVFANLLSNAVKYTRPRPRAVIEVGHLERDGQRILFVRDNGVGFSMKYYDKLFGVFQRFHRSEDFEGTGVGLATVQRIVRKHGGRVWAEAEVDKGATFFFTLAGSERAADASFSTSSQEVVDVGR
jgi:signal transduction histidine kinase